MGKVQLETDQLEGFEILSTHRGHYYPHNKFYITNAGMKISLSTANK
jgi:hypothetical protein